MNDLFQIFISHVIKLFNDFAYLPCVLDKNEED